jgi:hypothetical protein
MPLLLCAATGNRPARRQLRMVLSLTLGTSATSAATRAAQAVERRRSAASCMTDAKVNRCAWDRLDVPTRSNFQGGDRAFLSVVWEIDGNSEMSERVAQLVPQPVFVVHPMPTEKPIESVGIRSAGAVHRSTFQPVGLHDLLHVSGEVWQRGPGGFGKAGCSKSPGSSSSRLLAHARRVCARIRCGRRPAANVCVRCLPPLEHAASFLQVPVPRS